MALRDTLERLFPGYTNEKINEIQEEIVSNIRLSDFPTIKESDDPYDCTSPLDGDPTHPTPQVGDIWVGAGGQRARLKEHRYGYVWQADKMPSGDACYVRFAPNHGWSLVERDGKPWPFAKEHPSAEFPCEVVISIPWEEVPSKSEWKEYKTAGDPSYTINGKTATKEQAQAVLDAIEVIRSLV